MWLTNNNGLSVILSVCLCQRSTCFFWHAFRSILSVPSEETGDISYSDPQDRKSGSLYEVVAVGHGTKDEEMVLKVGDTVLYGKYAGTELDVEGTKYLIMRQSDVLAVLG